MKKIYLAILLNTLFLGAYAQCTPDESIESTGIFYNEEIPFCVGELYNEVFQIAVTNDTTMDTGLGFTIDASVDSAEIFSVNGLPNGISYDCPTANCKIRNSGGSHSHSCMVVSGTPTETGVFTVRFVFTLYGLGTNINQEVDLELTVQDCVPTGIPATNSSKKDISIYPQPATSRANIEIRLNNSSAVKVTIHDLLGQEVTKAYNGNLSAGVNNINISEALEGLKSGLYLITTDIDNSGKTESYTKRLVIE